MTGRFTHAEILRAMPQVRAGLSRHFAWFVHTSPEVYLPDIMRGGLQPNKDAPTPPSVGSHFGQPNVRILCMHPLGAKRVPEGAASTLILPIGAPEPRKVSFAVAGNELPDRVDLDWSYCWSTVTQRIEANETASIENLVVTIAAEFGSVAIYDSIPPDRLRVFCKGNRPADPGRWTPLATAIKSDVFLSD